MLSLLCCNTYGTYCTIFRIVKVGEDLSHKILWHISLILGHSIYEEGSFSRQTDSIFLLTALKKWSHTHLQDQPVKASNLDFYNELRAGSGIKL